NPFLIFAFTPFVVALWGWQSRRGREPSTVIKMAIGCFAVVLANLVLVAAPGGSTGAKVSWLLLAGHFVILTLRHLSVSRLRLSLSANADAAVCLAMTMGVWLATSFAGNFIARWLVSFWPGMPERDFFLMVAAIAAAAVILILACHRPLRSALKD